MTQMEMGLKLNGLAMMMDDKTYKNCKDTFDEIVKGVNELYNRQPIDMILKKLENDIDPRTMNVSQAEGYLRALEDVRKAVR